MLKIYSTAIIIVALFAINIFYVFKNEKNDVFAQPLKEDFQDANIQAYVLPISGPNYIPILNSNVSEPVIGGKSAAIYDIRSSRFLFEKEKDKKLPIASLTKIMTAVIVLEKFDQDEIITITDDSIKVDGTKQDLYLGEQMSIRNLLKLMLIESSNDAAYALANYAKDRGIDFISLMNDKAGMLKMTDTSFTDPAGLDDSAYSTVQDLIKLVEYSLNYQEIWDISAEKTAIIESSDEKIKHNIKSTNLLIGLIKDFIGGKTGYTDGAGQCMILVTKVSNYPSKIISIVLGSNDRFGDTQKLIDWTRKAYQWK